MVGPQMPGQNPAQQQMQQQRQQQMQYAWWKEQQQQEAARPPVHRPGFIVRFVLGLVSLALLVVVLVSLVGAGWAVKDGAPQFTAVGLGVAIVAGFLRRGIRRRARGF